MINKEESQQLDFILTFLSINKEEHFNTNKIAEVLETDFDTAYALCARLKEEELIWLEDTTSSDGLDQMISHHPKGKTFLVKGGFRAIFQEKQKRNEIGKEIQALQLTELRKKVEVMDKQIKEQSEFHRTSTQKNKEQIRYLKDQQLIIWVMLGITMLGLLFKIFIN